MGIRMVGEPMNLVAKLEEMQKSGKKVVSVDYVLCEVERMIRNHRQASRKAPYTSLDGESGQIVYREKKKA